MQIKTIKKINKGKRNLAWKVLLKKKKIPSKNCPNNFYEHLNKYPKQ